MLGNTAIMVDSDLNQADWNKTWWNQGFELEVAETISEQITLLLG